MNSSTAKKGGLGQYFRETKAELKKVTWPTKKETLQHTEVVLVAIAIISILLGAFDFGLGAVLDVLIK